MKEKTKKVIQDEDIAVNHNYEKVLYYLVLKEDRAYRGPRAKGLTLVLEQVQPFGKGPTTKF